MRSGVFERMLALAVACGVFVVGFAMAAQPAGASDLTAPQLQHVTITPSTVNITSSDQVVAVRVSSTDLGGSGVAGICVGFDVPNSSFPYRGNCLGPSALVAGTARVWRL